MSHPNFGSTAPTIRQDIEGPNASSRRNRYQERLGPSRTCGWMDADEQNLMLVRDERDVDAINAAFYSKFPYPWPPMSFPVLEDPDFERLFLNQSVGDFANVRVPSRADIWVAGCGTNQAVYTALRFPNASVVGSDISEASLEVANAQARQLGLKNLTLRHENISQARYNAEFDYVISTGVIHHNADPREPLRRLEQATRPHGIVEVMVYNRFHRIFTSAIQKAVRILCGQENTDPLRHDEELRIARLLARIEALPERAALQDVSHAPDELVADLLIQPVEQSYTVESFSQLASACGLKLMMPCPNAFDAANGRKWTIQLNIPELEVKVDALTEINRWQLCNLLLQENSPMLWFFLEKAAGSQGVQNESSANDAFLSRRFVPARTRLTNWVRTGAEYKRSATAVQYPLAPRGLPQDIVEHADGSPTMKELLKSLGIDVDNRTLITDIRNQTATTTCPYLKAT